MERFSAALPPLPVWDSLPVPATGRDKLDTAANVKAGTGDDAQAAQIGGETGAAGKLASGSAEAVPATEPDAQTAAGSSAAPADAQPLEAQPFASCDPPADAVADAMATDEPPTGSPEDLAAAGVDSALVVTHAADVEAEALAAADLAADSSLRDRRCAP